MTLGCDHSEDQDDRNELGFLLAHCGPDNSESIAVACLQFATEHLLGHCDRTRHPVRVM